MPSRRLTRRRHRLPALAAEQSSSEGFLVNDVFNFPDERPGIGVVFGCVEAETGAAMQAAVAACRVAHSPSCPPPLVALPAGSGSL